MSNVNGWSAGAQPAVYPLAPLPASALQSVRRRRIAALFLDLILVTILSVGIFLVLGVLTLGIAWLILPPLFPFVAFFYNGLTISGGGMATPGMKAMDLEMRLVDGSPTPFLHAAVHAVLFYLSWMFPPIFLLSLLAADKRCLHDMLAGVIVLRRV
ncbi:RDD family protein [uncultured Rhodoblastus sp.]|uniref:RDD family protein n=1 Tax=uncultured Rhodoblastus sp. TaxID=543037 RepID=UPI0025EBBA43|nr:RDD family protein [uncultured Rhodoblastus sp.]